MELGSKRSFLLTLFVAAALFLTTGCRVFAANESSRPADLVNNEKVVYTLPDVGSITPENPLFFIKQIRDNVLLILPQENEPKARLMIQMSDKYTVYADQMQRSSKSEKALSMFESSFKLQDAVVRLLESGKGDPSLSDIKDLALQSNIKQAEMIRLLMDDVSSSEQTTLVQHLNANMLLRKKLQAL